MRTTIDIEDDVLQAAKELAKRERVSAGHVVSRLLRLALLGAPDEAAQGPKGEMERASGFRPFSSPKQRVVTNEMIDELRDAEGI